MRCVLLVSAVALDSVIQALVNNKDLGPDEHRKGCSARSTLLVWMAHERNMNQMEKATAATVISGMRQT